MDEVIAIDSAHSEKRADRAAKRPGTWAADLFPLGFLCRCLSVRRVIFPLLVCAFQYPALTETANPEALLKARLVYQFALLTEWPSDVLPPERSTNFIVGIFGNDSLAQILTAATNLVQNHKLEVKQLIEFNEAENCHLVFVGKTDVRKLAELFARLKDASVLTVGEGDEFLRMGGMIKLWEEPRVGAKRFHFEVNRDAARRAKLSLSSQLLRLSEPEKRSN